MIHNELYYRELRACANCKTKYQLLMIKGVYLQNTGVVRLAEGGGGAPDNSPPLLVLSQ
jgi:hypothetical protein